ncbi:acyl carrier protein [Sulfuricystis multivorans]|uniref:acyl carrier protein n=1 Tax=Sulfuricystis multivorans TaxID=2211108 RepID=UPI000F84DED3|nr:acyl carrier protein [Sulfuricystis multivorans]
MNRQQLLEIIKEVFPDARFDPSDISLGLGSFPQWDSLGNFNLLLQVEAIAGIRFSSEEISEIKSLAGIIASLERRGIYAD